MTLTNRAVAAIPFVLATSLLVSSAYAQVPDKPGAAQHAMVKFSEAGSSAMRSIRGARIAIFNGEPVAALKLMESAKRFFEDADKGSPSIDVTTKMTIYGSVVRTSSYQGDIKGVPVDGQVILPDSVPTLEQQKHIDKANEYIRLGNTVDAIKELSLGDIDVKVNQSWVPIAPSIELLDHAIRLASDGRYYEGSLALKAIESGVVTGSISVRDVLLSTGK